MADAPVAFEARADKSLLIVDDDRPFSTRLARAMEGRGYVVRVAESVAEGSARREVYQPMAKWVSDNPPFPGRAWAQWIRWMYQDRALVNGRLRLRGSRVDLGLIEQNVLVVTAGADHIAPRDGTMPIFDLVSSEDVTHFDRPGGHIGLMAGSAARKEIWPDLAAWLAERSEG